MKVEILKQNGHNFLWIDGELWMWDVPTEMMLQEELAKQAYGKVLVVGHGLGIVQTFLEKNKAVESIETVEKYEEVRTAYFNHFNKHIPGSVILNDFYNLPDPNYQRWDCIIGDIWIDIHPKYLEEYKKFKKHAEMMLKPQGKIVAWGKDYFEWLLTQ